jgi:repressor LexA
LAQENWEGTIDLDKKVADTGEFFALRIKGDSMIPAFFEGDIVIIRKQNYCENNQFAVVIINGEEGTLKKVKKTDEGIILQPINPAYAPVMYTNKEIKEKPIVIAGVFQELRRTEMKF